MERSLVEEVQGIFESQFGTKPTQTAIAPGRAELLGNHTDYNQGLVMALALDKYVVMAGAPRDDGRVRLYSQAFQDTVEFSLQQIEKDPAHSWAHYTKGLILQLQQRGIRFGGMDAVIHSTVPLGAGLSSSAALLVASAVLLRKLFPYRLLSFEKGENVPGDQMPPMDEEEKMLLARVCQAAENQFVGVNCGLLDHISSLFGRADHAILIDCLDLHVEWSPLPDSIGVVIAHSGVRHALVGGEYNERRASCERAAQKLGVPSLRHVTLSMLEEARGRLEETEYRYALHVVGENERVREGSALLREGKLEEFGQKLFESHESSRVNFRNSCPELDTLVELAREHPACIGARLSGGGWGGATINLVRREGMEDFLRYLASGYSARQGRSLEAWPCRIVEGAH